MKTDWANVHHVHVCTHMDSLIKSTTSLYLLATVLHVYLYCTRRPTLEPLSNSVILASFCSLSCKYVCTSKSVSRIEHVHRIHCTWVHYMAFQRRLQIHRCNGSSRKGRAGGIIWNAPSNSLNIYMYFCLSVLPVLTYHLLSFLAHKREWRPGIFYSTLILYSLSFQALSPPPF